MLSSLIITCWVGFGQSVAKHYGHVKVSAMPTTIEGCPAAWKEALLDITTTTTTTTTTTPSSIMDEHET